MENAKVIQFPKEKSMRKVLQDRVQEQKAILVLSIASVVLMTVFVNQWMIDNAEHNLASRIGSQNRQVASFDKGSIERDIKWEHSLAQELNSNDSLQAHLAEKPSVRDQLIFGYLQGKYGMKLSDQRISSLEFIDAQAGEYPMVIADRVSFLKKYSAAFGRKYVEVASVQSAENPAEKIYNLIDSSKAIIGQALFSMDEKGRVKAIHFTEL